MATRPPPKHPCRLPEPPPLDGIWATAPYLHNGSVPTLYDMLNSKPCPKIFTRSFKTGEEDYDKTKVGCRRRSQVLDWQAFAGWILPRLLPSR